ncbi:ABC transporter permease [Schaalia vaccimaxillae]|uniref:ABC transporter permease n=1 Tax=Schaalia vaccimaxillae TaxID=183916 RepID=UPI00041E3F7F|nr:ABC transporter permease [Schaalia vaccimaxillae]
MMSQRSESFDDLGQWVAAALIEHGQSRVKTVPTWRLHPVSARPGIFEYCRKIWQRRFFILADSRAKAFSSSRGTTLGKTWLILRPFLDAMVFFAIFGLLLQTGRGIDNFLAYLVVGMNTFGLMQAGLNSGGTILPGAKNMLRAFSFPRASLVFSWSLRGLFDFLPVLLATILFIMVVPPHVKPSTTWILVVPVVVLVWIFSIGLALITASLTARIPDLKFIWPLLSRFWFYGSGIFFSIDRFADHPAVMALMTANPGYQVLNLMRQCLVYDTIPETSQWAYVLAWVLGTFVLGFVIFWSHEESYGREG